MAENTTAVTTVTATDADLPAQTLTYSISGGVDAAKFTINPSTHVLSFKSAPNFESPTDVGANNVYNVTVQVSDGSLTDTQVIAVHITNVNELPSVTIQTGLAIVNNNCPQPPPVGVISGNTISAIASDPETPVMNLSKQWTGGGSQIIFTSATALIPTVSLPNTINSFYGAITLTVTDPGGKSSSDKKCIKVCRSGTPNCP